MREAVQKAEFTISERPIIAYFMSLEMGPYSERPHPCHYCQGPETSCRFTQLYQLENNGIPWKELPLLWEESERRLKAAMLDDRHTCRECQPRAQQDREEAVRQEGMTISAVN